MIHILLSILLALSFSLPCKAEDDFKLLRTERIGPLKTGLPANQVQTLLKSKPESGPSEKWEADGMYHQSWSYARQGIVLDMVSQTKHSAKSVDRITISSPCRFSTQRGIHIGSAESEVEQAYRNDLNQEDSTQGAFLVAGSVYGGLMFKIQNGKVIEIILGAIAE
ncbi:MAG: hypothetical protein PHE55_11465 [Methylococcaceae bacterium]|nr:hypothetical protein [Methylococcaceae bacterium]